MPPAGIPSVRTDLPRPIVPPNGCRAYLENLGNETSSKALLNPSIFTTYGLSHRDFFKVCNLNSFSKKKIFCATIDKFYI